MAKRRDDESGIEVHTEPDQSDLEPDPEADLRDYESEYAPDPPSVDVPDDVDVPEYVQRAFWSAVVLANVALLAVGLGVLFGVANGEWRRAGAAFLVAGIATAHGYRIYRRFERRHADELAEEGDDGDRDDTDGPDGTEPATGDGTTD
ncbi:hypothetical protein BRD17_01505 [Halobacteriales archaeon SW_7_68_16]|nr:MAG: hypothetical protein BRD17_01505 [Halobacteriales archaeon SW_7_68_16]